MDARKKKNYIILASVAGGLIALLVLLSVLRTFSSAVADFMCRYVTRPWVYIVGHIQSVFSFSLFEFFILTVIVAAIFLLILTIRALKEKQGQKVLKGLLIVLICILSVCNGYTLLAGFAYYRPAAPVPQSEREYAPEQVTQMVRYFADDYNALAQKFERDKAGNVISPYTFDELSDKLQTEYARLGGDYYFSYTPHAKRLLNSWFLTLNNISGITFVPMAEPAINCDIPSSDVAQTMAHEMAHAKGVMREGEANFVSYYILLSSQDDYLRYCGYFSTFYSLLPAVNANTNIKKDYEEIRKNISPLIRAEILTANRFWTEKSMQPGLAGLLNRTFEKIGNAVNNLFLKSNGADNGNGSYSDKVTDGTVTDSGISNPDTGEIFYNVTYSSLQKMYFAVYEACAA